MAWIGFEKNEWSATWLVEFSRQIYAVHFPDLAHDKWTRLIWNGGDNMASILAKILDGEITSEDLVDPCQIDRNEVSCILET